jgi:hypothetical protein
MEEIIMATKKTSKKPALKLVKTSTTKTGMPSDRKAIILEFLSKISYEVKPEPPKEEPDTCSYYAVNNHFACGASQFNADLALAATCESEGDIFPDDDTLLRHRLLL